MKVKEGKGKNMKSIVISHGEIGEAQPFSDEKATDENFKKMSQMFSIEAALLDGEYKEAISLYLELKKNFDDIRNSRSPGTLRFVSEQTRNLVGIRAHILNVIKEKVGMKKTLQELSIKAGAVSDTEDTAKLRALLELINKERSGHSDEDAIEVIAKRKADSSDRLLEERLRSPGMDIGSGYNPSATAVVENLEVKDRKKKKKERESDHKERKDLKGPLERKSSEAEEMRVVFDEHGNQYVVDSEYRVQTDYEAPSIEVEFKEKDGFLIAVDADGDEYEVVEFGVEEE